MFDEILPGNTAQDRANIHRIDAITFLERYQNTVIKVDGQHFQITDAQVIPDEELGFVLCVTVKPTAGITQGVVLSNHWENRGKYPLVFYRQDPA